MYTVYCSFALTQEMSLLPAFKFLHQPQTYGWGFDLSAVLSRTFQSITTKPQFMTENQRPGQLRGLSREHNLLRQLWVSLCQSRVSKKLGLFAVWKRCSGENWPPCAERWGSAAGLRPGSTCPLNWAHRWGALHLHQALLGLLPPFFLFFRFILFVGYGGSLLLHTGFL